MKIRHGFVSNSSTTSFCIYGICIEAGEEIIELAERSDMFSRFSPDGDSIYIGKEWCAIGDNETGAQFKKSTQEKIEKFVLTSKLKGFNIITDSLQCSTIQEAWHDG